MDLSTFLRLGSRNLVRQRRRFVLLVVSIGLGFLIITVMNALSGGMIRSINISAARHYAGHLFVLGHQKVPYYTPVIRDHRALMEAVEAAGLDPQLVVRRTNYFERGMLYFGGSSARQKRITGVDWSVEEEIFRRMEFVSGGVDNLAGSNGILISEPIADTLNVRVGDDILVQVETVSGQRNTGVFMLRGVFRDSSIFGYFSSYVDLRRLNRLIGLADDEYTVLGLYLKDLRLAENAAQRLHRELSSRVAVFPPVATQSDLWRHLDEQWEGVKYAVLTLDGYLYQVRNLLSAFDAASYFLLSLVVGIVMIGITVTYRVIVFERTREIGTMRALGLSRGGVVALFLVEALLLALAAMLVGGIGALLSLRALSCLSFDWIPGFEIFMERGRIAPFLPPKLAVVNVAIVCAVTLAAAWIPARSAARVDPAQALRADG
jgi:putative ABC transport system permease protein